MFKSEGPRLETLRGWCQRWVKGQGLHHVFSNTGGGSAEGREESGICDSGRGVLTHAGCGRKVNSPHKELNYSFIINTNVHTDTLHILFLCSLCLWVLGGAAWLERPEHLPAAQISPLQHQLLSIYCEGKKRQKPQWLIRADRQENDLPPTHTHMVTFSGDSEVILQHSGFFLKRSEVDLSPLIQTHFIPSPALSGKCFLQAKLFFMGAKSSLFHHHHWIQKTFLQTVTK